MHERIRLIVEEEGEPLFFSSLGAAESHLEAIDVDDGVYPRAYGPDGKLYRVSSDEDRVVIVEDEGSSARPDELESLVRSYLSAVGVAMAASDDLETLLRKCEAHLIS